jgi:hypothetical protein
LLIAMLFHCGRDVGWRLSQENSHRRALRELQFNQGNRGC